MSATLTKSQHRRAEQRRAVARVVAENAMLRDALERIAEPANRPSSARPDLAYGLAVGIARRALKRCR